MPTATGKADRLNRECSCAATDLPSVRNLVDRAVGAAGSITDTHPHLFSSLPVFLDRHHFEQMQLAIAAIDRVTGSEAYRRHALATAPAVARHEVPYGGVFFGYDFHISVAGPKLIEINTNAGGAFLNIAARDAQIACCESVAEYLSQIPDGRSLEGSVIDMFRREWKLARGDAPLRRIAIVDENPRGQFLYPEFLLAKQLLEAHGIETRIAEPGDLNREGDRIVLGDQPIDLIYNRSTDFYFQAASSRVLREAFENDLAVVTPHPRAHALHANKRNLIALSSRDQLTALGTTPNDVDVLLRTIPQTEEVARGDERWWAERKSWFFKPESGFGSRGTYRGDKLTRRVFTEISRGEYIAQALTPAGERIRTRDDQAESFKVDIRCYVYQGNIQLMAARLYQGQTTNFRTAGGGFAPVYVVA
jgi:hypothetical protein